MQIAWRAAKACMAATLTAALGATAALAQPAAPGAGQPKPWQLDLQTSGSTVMDFIHSLHTSLVVVIVLISLFVLALLAYVSLKFNEKANPTPSRTTHNTAVEVAWTVVPVMILLAIVIPSFRLSKYQEEIPPSDVTIKVTGKQWYWTVEYAKDSGGFGFDAILLDDKQRAEAIQKGAKPEDVPRLLAVDNEIVVPINKAIRIQVTAADVMHAFAIPALGIKRDAVPGRLNETWFRATREGLYYGQCSELCGTNHAYMPKAIRVVSEAAYATWLEGAKTKYAATTDDRAMRVAGAKQ